MLSLNNLIKVKALALSVGFKLKEQPDGTMDLNPYVYKFADHVFHEGVASVPKYPTYSYVTPPAELTPHIPKDKAAELWQADAQRYALNAEYWRTKFEALHKLKLQQLALIQIIGTIPNTELKDKDDPIGDLQAEARQAKLDDFVAAVNPVTLGAVRLNFAVSATQYGTTISIVQPHSDGSHTLLYSGEHSLGDHGGVIYTVGVKSTARNAARYCWLRDNGYISAPVDKAGMVYSKPEITDEAVDNLMGKK